MGCPGYRLALELLATVRQGHLKPIDMPSRAHGLAGWQYVSDGVTLTKPR